SIARGVATNTTSCRSASRTGRGSEPLATPLSGAPSAATVGLLRWVIRLARFERHDLREQSALQITKVERLLDKVVGAEIERLQRLIVVGVAADHDDRSLRRFLTEALQRLDAVHAGHGDIEQDDLRSEGLGHLQRLAAVLGPLRGVAVVGEKLDQHLADGD